MRFMKGVAIGGIAMLTVACSDSDDDHDAKADDHGKATHAEKASHAVKHADYWAYEGDGAPHAWGVIKEEYATCGDGMQQSPIDISTVTIGPLSKIEFKYRSTPLELVNNGHTIQANYHTGSYITVGGKRYDLLQLHFHAPTEHTVGGKSYDMVAHLVHKAADGQLGVIGVMFKAGDKNKEIEKLWANMPTESGQTNTVKNTRINALDLLPVDLTYFNYTGSLTTPPCSEGVNWMVMATPASISAKQVKQFTDLFPASVRPVQPLNGRVVRTSN
ncbi:MAG: carbonic anhydrase family protein [Gammaproteobacteria bacterium]|nr:carbonic anhydrase family protein [Gammaproteobacteria bacterium]